MKILFLLNCDIHCVKALSLLLPYLKKHDVSFLLSRKVGNFKNVSEELLKIKEAEGYGVEESLKKIQRNWGCLFEFVDDVNSTQQIERVKEMAPQLIISIRFGQILREKIIEIPQLGVVNLHSGILPKYRGVMASFWAILQGEREIGTTLHYIEDSRIDTGAVIAVSRRSVDFGISLVENIHRLYDGGVLDIIEFLKRVEDGQKIELVEQENLGVGAYYSFPTQRDLLECEKIIRLV